MSEHRFRLMPPSRDVVASVRHREVPGSPPDPLIPFVVPILDEGRLVDWRLTDDTLAFGDHEVPTMYLAWRADWERRWQLDPVDAIERLVAVARELGDGTTALGRLASSVFELQLQPDEAAEVADAARTAQLAVRERGAFGFGFVDATHDAGRTGLARAWSPAGGPQVVASDDHLIVEMRPDDGLAVLLRPPGTRQVNELSGVAEVELRGGTMALRRGEQWVEIAAELARPLAWLVPGSTRWRIRQVPEVIVWARTFVGLAEAAAMAERIDAPVGVSATALVQTTP